MKFGMCGNIELKESASLLSRPKWVALSLFVSITQPHFTYLAVIAAIWKTQQIEDKFFRNLDSASPLATVRLEDWPRSAF
jgi:hypothetical protein